MTISSSLGNDAFVVPDSHLDLLRRPLVAFLATVAIDGSPHVSPMWFRWDGRHLLMSHTRRRQKFRNINSDSRVAIGIVDPADHLRYLEIRGIVESIEDDSELVFYRGLRELYAATHPLRHAAERVILRISPVKAIYR